MPDNSGWSSAGFVYSDSSETVGQQQEEVKAIESSDEPYANEVGIPGSTELQEQDRQREGMNTELLFELIRKSPEALSIMNAIVDDVVGSGFDFKYLGETSGRRRRADARQFWNSGAKEQVAEAILDTLIVGDGYLFKRKLDDSEVKSVVEDYLHDTRDFNLKSSYKLAAYSLTDELKAQDEDLFSTRNLQMVPASTIEHQINERGDIVNFHQEVGANEADLDPDKVIHFNFMRLNGKTYGFTPARSIVSELSMLANAKDHNGIIFENAGVVNKIFKLENEGPKSANYKLLKRTIKKFRKLQNKHRDLVLTGEVEVEDLNSIGEDMDFQELATYLTRVIVMAWGVPPTRVGLPVGGESGARVTSLTHEGYFKRISRLQDTIETVLNQELFEPEFNVHISFENPDTKSEIRKADRDMRQLEVAKQKAALGVWSRNKVMDYLGVDDFEAPDLEDDDDVQFMQIAAQLASNKDNILSDREVENDPAQDEMDGDMQATSNGENGNTS